MAKKGDVRMKFDFTELFKGLDGYSVAVQSDLREGGVEVGEDGLMRMVEAAPVMSGFLRGSGSVHVNDEFVSSGKDLGHGKGNPNVGSGVFKKLFDTTLIVWGFNAFYAAARHELDQAGIKAGGGKFVENVLKEEMKRWMEHLASRLRKLKK